MVKIVLKENNQLIFIFLWSSLWLSIGTYPIEKSLFSSDLGLNEYFFKMRLYTPLIISSLIFILIILKKIKFNFKNIGTPLIFLLIFIFQGIGLFLNKYKLFEFSDWQLIMYAIISILVVSTLNTKSLKIIQFLNLFFIILAFIIFVFPVYKTFFDLNNNNLFMYFNLYWEETSFGSPNARVTGIARYCLIILIFLYSYVIATHRSKNVLVISLFLIFFLILNIWMLQSRLIIGTLLIVFFTSLLIKNKEINNFKLISCFILISLTVYIFFSVVQNVKKKLIINNSDSTSINKLNKKIEDLENEKITRLIKIQNSSGRAEIWEKLFNSYDKSKIFGYGSQADRYLLDNNLNKKQLDNNASNAILYSFVSGGYFAALMLIIILISSGIINLKILKAENKNINFNYLDINAFLIINFFLIRQLFENSFSVFSVDLLIFLSSYFYLLRRLEK